VHHHLRRLAAAGQLSPEAELIYGPKKKKDTGPVLVFDEFIKKQIETLKMKHGHHPSIQQLSKSCTPPQPDEVIQNSLLRLATAGRLTKEAVQIYNIKTGDVKNEGTKKGRKARK